MAGPSPHLQPTVEDYNSDDSDGHGGPALSSLRGSPAANVAAKRSHPSDLGLDKTPPVEAAKVASLDLQSDSGYSTVHSAMSSAISSADSATSVKSSQSPPSIPPAAPSLPPPSPAMKPIVKRRPTIGDDRKLSSQSSPRKPQRSGSVSTRKPRERRQTVDRGDEEECTDPNCTECISAPLPRGRRPPLLASAFDDSYSFDQRSQRSDPASSYISSPQSPTYTRPTPSYNMQGSAVIVPAQSTRRRASSSTRAARPLSYHAGDPGSYWAMQSQPYSNPPEARGPPPSMSAHYSMHPPTAPFIPPPQSNYFPPVMGHPMSHPSQFDPQSQRPPMPPRTSYNARGYGPAVVTQETTGMPSARYASTPSARPEQLIATEYETESSEYTSSDEEPERYSTRVDRTRAIMPPPPVPTKTSNQRRPSLRHAATTQVYNEHRMTQSQTLPARPREPDPRERSTRGGTAASSRASSTIRPALIQHPKAQSAIESTHNARVVVENQRSQRRQSYQGYEKPLEEKQKRRANRNSKIYGEDQIRMPKAYAPEEEKERRRANQNSRVYADDEIPPPPVYAPENKRSSRLYTEDAMPSRSYSQDAIVPHRRRQTDSDIRRRDDQPAETKSIRDAEAYQRTMRGSIDPLTEKIHKAAKRASRAPSGPSHAESSRSGSDKASRISHHTAVTNDNTGEIRLRVDASAPLSLQFNGDMEGRTVHIEPMENGMADIVIGNPGSNPDSMYRGERVNLLGPAKVPKAIMPSQHHWEDEEMPIRTEYNSHGHGHSRGRREGERRVLQRRRKEIELH